MFLLPYLVYIFALPVGRAEYLFYVYV